MVIANTEEASVGTIYLTATNDAYDDIIIATMSGAELPTVVQRDAVTETDGKVICTIQTNVSDEGKNPEKTEVITIKGADNVQEATNGYTNVTALTQLVLEAPTGTEGAGAEYIGNDTSVAEGDKEATLEAATIFAGGNGTENNPYLIADFDSFQHVNDSYNNKKYEYYKVKDGITEIDMTGWTSINLTGYIEGNNVTLKNLTAPLFVKASYDSVSTKTNTIKNMKIEANIVSPGGWVAVVFRSYSGTNLLIDNVDLSGYVEGGYVASYLCQDWTGTKTIRNCTSSLTLFGSGACGGMTGYIGMGGSSDCLNLILENSLYNGTMIRSSNSNFTYLGFNTNSGPSMTLTLDAASAAADFTIKGAAPEAKTYTGKWNDFGSGQTVYTNESKKVVGNLTPSVNINGKIEVNAGAGTRAVATLMVGPNPGNMYAAYMVEEMNLSGNNFVTNKLNDTFTIQIDKTKETGFISDSVFNLKYDGDGTIHCANIVITVYDSMNNVINVGTIAIDSSRFPHE